MTTSQTNRRAAIPGSIALHLLLGLAATSASTARTQCLNPNQGSVFALGHEIRSHGDSTGIRFRHHLEIFAEAVLEVIEQEGRRRAVVVLDAGATYAELMRAVLDSGATVHACDRIESDLEEAFARIMDSDEEPDR